MDLVEIEELKRLQELESFLVMDGSQDPYLNDIAKIAALSCDAPISQITFVGKEYTRIKANFENDRTENINGKVKREDSFCQHNLHNPNEMLIVNDACKDSRFCDNPFVKSKPRIRFYAGKSLKTKTGRVVGSICIIDKKARKISKREVKIFKILAKKVMEYLRIRRNLLAQKDHIKTHADNLKKLTDNLPIGIFQLVKLNNGKMKFEFLSREMKMAYPCLIENKWFQMGQLDFSQIHPDDFDKLKNHFSKNLENLSLSNIDFRVKNGREYSWYHLRAKSEEQEDGGFKVYGSIRDISDRMEYESALEQIAFDISHILRRPLTNLLGLNNLISDQKSLTKKELLEYIEYIKIASQEMEAYTRDLHDVYQIKKETISNQSK